jgi:hypothetical protein
MMARLVFAPGEDRLLVERHDGSRIDDFRLDTSRKDLRRLLGDLDYGARRDEGDVAACAENVGDAEGDQILLLGDRAFS